MVHATTRNKQKTRNRLKNHCFGKLKTGAPHAPRTTQELEHLYKYLIQKKVWKFTNFKFAPPNVTDRAENWHTSTTPSGQSTLQSWTQNSSISKSYDQNKFCLVSLLENASKNSHFCLNSFSAVSTYFSILSSLSVRIRPHLALETQNFRSIDENMMKNLHSKCEKCNFDPNFRPRKKILFFHFLQYGARSRPPVDGIESKTQKFVDTAENEPIQNSSIS
jgi:hypothetical protein